MLNSRQLRANRGNNILTLIENMDSSDDEALHKMSDDEASLTDDSEDSSDGERDNQKKKRYDPDAIDSSDLGEYSSSYDSDFSATDESGRLDSQSEGELERKAKREDRNERKKETVVARQKRGRGKDGKVVFRTRAVSAISQEDRMKMAHQHAERNTLLLAQYQADIQKDPAAGQPALKSKRKKGVAPSSENVCGYRQYWTQSSDGQRKVETVISFDTLPPGFTL